jgi:hypothetical protein
MLAGRYDRREEGSFARRQAGIMKLAAHGADAGMVQRIKTAMTG